MRAASLVRIICCLFIMAALPVMAAGQRVFIVYSYHPGYFWQQDEERGIKKALSDMDITYGSYALDSKKHQTREWLDRQVGICLKRIKLFQPDVIMTCDDNASKTIGKTFLGQETPVVFLGLNGEPEDYGLVEPGKRQRPGGNITGVLERHYYQDATALLQSILLANKRKVDKLDILTDDSATSAALLQFLKGAHWKTPWEQVFLTPQATFSHYKKQFLAINQPGHAVFIYNLETFKDNAGQNVSDEKVIAWTSRHLSVAAVAFHEHYLEKGAGLCGVVVSGKTQGCQAGLKVKQILKGMHAGDIPIDRPPKGTVILNVSVAERLGMKIPLEILLGADILYDVEK